MDPGVRLSAPPLGAHAMALVNAERLLSRWHTEQHLLIRPCSLPDTRWILEAALGSTLVNDVSLSSADARDLVNGLFEHRQATERPITRRIATKRVNRVLEQLNSLPGISAVLIPEPTPVHRPTALPNTSYAFTAAQQMLGLDRRLLTWCRQSALHDAWLLVLAIRLMTRLGMSERVVLGTLSQLTHQHIGRATLAIPSSPDATWPDDGHYRIALPDDVWVPLRAIVTREKHRPASEWLLFTNDEAQTLDTQQRRQALRRRLRTAAGQMLNTLTADDLPPSASLLKSWSAVVYASRHVPVLRGIAPLWSTLLREYPLPTCTPVPLLLGQDGAHQYSPGQRLGRLPDRQAIRGVSNDAQAEVMPEPQEHAVESEPECRAAGVRLIPTEQLPIGWRRKTKNILQQFLADVGRLPEKSFKAKNIEKPMQELLDQYEKRLNRQIGHRGHYPAWVLHFLYHQLRTEGNTLSTAKTQLSRLTPITLLLHDAVLDMSDWDDDVVLELEIAAQSGKHWQPKTLESFRVTFRQFMRFCQRYGVLEDVTLPKHATSSSPSVLRTRILSPDHMQAVWEALTQQVPDGDPRQMTALVIALAFYGGLRASEIESLTLRDVQIGIPDNSRGRSFWIDILGGKTAAARRRIALHIMAPPSVVEQLREWVEVRRHSCNGTALSDIALFGPRHSPDAYKRRYLITLAIEEMRYLLGEDIDFHGLRHAAVSWTLLRLHASQNPGFADTLQHRHHWMLQPEVLQETLRYFCGAEGPDTLARGTVLLHVAKWIGHRDPATLLENYAHTLGLIHGDILAPKRSKNRGK